MKRIGLTGGIGMGKTAVAERLSARGIQVIDTDRLARELTSPGQPALQEIAERFGREVFEPDGSLNRRRLAERVFGDLTARKDLERILHPRIRAEWKARSEEWRNAGAPLAVVVIPLLYETGAEQELDQVICVACTAQTQQGRLTDRHWTAEEIGARIRAQWPVAKKMALADYVLWSEGSFAVLNEQIERVVESMRAD